MLTEYNGQIFNAEVINQEVKIWKYIPVDGFQKITTDRGITYYKKTVSLDEVGEFFSVSFFAFKEDRKFIIDALDADNINVICDDEKYAEANSFYESEHGIWMLRKPIDEFGFDYFQFVKSIENSDDKTVMDIDKEQLMILWQKYVASVRKSNNRSGKTMEQILEYKGIKLIKKYDLYYIRFTGGQQEETLCDLRITNDEAISIIASPEKIKDILDDYKKKTEWTQSFFVNSLLKDYMFYECNLNDKMIEKNLQKLDRHEDIKFELYETLIYESFPESGAIEVCGYTAKKLNETTHLTILGAYNFLIYLKEDEKNALEDLKNGLQIK